MKKYFYVAALAVSTLLVNAQGTSEIPNSFESTNSVVVNKNYNRVIFGYAPTKFKAEGESATAHGFSAAWLGGYNVTKGKRLPLYIEPGVAMNMGFGEVMSESDKLLNIEVPVNVTYRYNIPNTKIRLSPYFGFHCKVNVLCLDKDGLNWFDYDVLNRFQFGMQLGANIDFNRFSIGVGWNKDFIPFADFDGINMNTSGLRVNLGIVF